MKWATHCEGVSVQLKGTSIGTITNANGEYQLTLNAKTKAVIVFTTVGMEKQELSAEDNRDLMVTLMSAVTEEQEVVVVGYGTQKKHAVTGAVAKADLKTYDKVPVNNIMETLKGTVAGLNVGEANTAGGVPGFTIRGTNSMGSTAPLIVLDGVMFQRIDGRYFSG